MVTPTVLDRLIDEIGTSSGPMPLVTLAARLGVQPSALQGMLETLERKGVLRVPAASNQAFACSSGCNASCTGVDSCPFVTDVPAPQPLFLRRR